MSYIINLRLSSGMALSQAPISDNNNYLPPFQRRLRAVGGAPQGYKCGMKKHLLMVLPILKLHAQYLTVTRWSSVGSHCQKFM